MGDPASRTNACNGGDECEQLPVRCSESSNSSSSSSSRESSPRAVPLELKPIRTDSSNHACGDVLEENRSNDTEHSTPEGTSSLSQEIPSCQEVPEEAWADDSLCREEETSVIQVDELLEKRNDSLSQEEDSLCQEEKEKGLLHSSSCQELEEDLCAAKSFTCPEEEGESSACTANEPPQNVILRREGKHEISTVENKEVSVPDSLYQEPEESSAKGSLGQGEEGASSENKLPGNEIEHGKQLLDSMSNEEQEEGVKGTAAKGSLSRVEEEDESRCSLSNEVQEDETRGPVSNEEQEDETRGFSLRGSDSQSSNYMVEEHRDENIILQSNESQCEEEKEEITAYGFLFLCERGEDDDGGYGFFELENESSGSMVYEDGESQQEGEDNQGEVLSSLSKSSLAQDEYAEYSRFICGTGSSTSSGVRTMVKTRCFSDPPPEAITIPSWIIIAAQQHSEEREDGDSFQAIKRTVSMDEGTASTHAYTNVTATTASERNIGPSPSINKGPIIKRRFSTPSSINGSRHFRNYSTASTVTTTADTVIQTMIDEERALLGIVNTKNRSARRQNQSQRTHSLSFYIGTLVGQSTCCVAESPSAAPPTTTAITTEDPGVTHNISIPVVLSVGNQENISTSRKSQKPKESCWDLMLQPSSSSPSSARKSSRTRRRNPVKLEAKYLLTRMTRPAKKLLTCATGHKNKAKAEHKRSRQYEFQRSTAGCLA